MNRHLRSILLVLSLFLTQAFVAQKLYWVGGSGNFNDPAHWSQQSGGIGGVKTPTTSDDVYFDENSFRSKSVISIIGGGNCRDLIFSDYTPSIILSGTQNEKLIVSGNLKLNPYIDNQFFGDLQLVSSKINTQANFGISSLKGNLYFDGTGSWDVATFSTADNSIVYLNNGRVKLVNGSINSGSILIGDNATIEVTESVLKAKNKLWFNNASTLIDNGLYIEAPINDPSSYHAGNNQISANRMANGNNSTLACGFTFTITSQPKCASSCDGVVVFTIPASCSGSAGAPYSATWSAVNTCSLPPGTPANNLSVGTYTQTNICGCGSAYTIVFKDNTGTFMGSANVNIAAPSLIQDFPIPSPPSCNAACDGKIYLTTIGGTQPYSVKWNPGPTHNNNFGSDSIIGLCAPPLAYTVTITDAHNCVLTDTSVSMTVPTTVLTNGNSVAPTCFGTCNGYAWVAPSGGTPFGAAQSNGIHYTTVWDGNAALNNDTLLSLCASSTHTCVVKDKNGCTATYIVTIGAGPADITFIKNPASGTLNIPCISACTGNVGVTSVAGGTGAYAFSWLPTGGTIFPGGNSSVYSGLCGSVAGLTYTCTIKDANNCTKTASFTVKAPSALSTATAAINPKCNTGATGSATVTESGGLSPYTFTWNPAGTVSGTSPKSINSNLAGGTYTVIATDFNGCTDTATVVLTPPPALTASITTVINPTCPNLNNGQLCVKGGGGTPAYTYSWSPASAGTASCTPATLVSGTYPVIVTDANSCTVTTSATLVPPPSITVTAAITQPSCAGSSNGSATLTATGGGGGFTYQWSCSASTGSTISGISGGTTCNYTVTDVNHCRQTGSVVFTSVSPVTLSLSPTILACSGNCNAQITTSVGGGTPGYTYAWSGSNPTCVACPNQTNMCAGTYTCTVTDAHGCSKTANTSIAAPIPITVTFTPVNPTCAGSCNGSINTSIAGGTGTYTSTSWLPTLPAPNPSTTQHPTNLCANTYSFQVTDNNGCTVTDTVSLIDPTPVTISLTTTSITCAGQNNGTASVTASGGTPSYQYNWDNTGFGANSSQSNLTSGTHTVIVKDSKGCLAVTQIFTINQPTALTTTVANIINTCNGLCNGGATASPSGGVPNYQYSWDAVAGPFSSGTMNISGLCAGSHTLFVKDSNNCSTSATFSINPVINISISSSSTSVSCHNLCDATATAIASGSANPPYTIKWVGSNTCNNVPASSPCIGTNLCGTVTVTATDASGCSNTTTLTITNPPALTATTNTTSVECFGLCTGTATVTPSGGTPEASAPFYSIVWSPAPLPNGTTENNLCPGTYTATITDNNGCKLLQPVTIGVSNQFTVTPSITAPSTCGASDASISLAISGGSGTYTVNWNTGSKNNPLTNISAGTYTAIINDGNGCDTTLVYAVNNLTGPTTTVTVNNNVTCPGQNNGSATVSGSGNGAITVTWPNPNPTGPSPQTGTNLSGSPTNYIVKVTDAVGCITNATVTVTSPPIIKDNATVIQPSCTGTLGSITLNPSGGNGGPYSFSWNGGAFTVGNNSLTGLSSGVYTCVIEDASGCFSSTFSYTMSTTNSPSVTVSPGSVTCSYSKNGTANASATGGLPAYTYTWTNSSNVVVAQGVGVSNVIGLSPDTYTLSVNDANNCNVQSTFTITAPAVINPNFVKTNNLCNGGSTGAATVTPTGGTGTYTVNWNTTGNPTTPTVSAVAPGSYQVIIYDANACSDTVNFTITKPSVLTITTASTNPTCFNLANGSATITAVSGGTPYTAAGTPPYTLSWTGVSCPTCSAVTNLSGNFGYTAIAADSNGCSVSQSFTLTSPPQISPSFTLNPPACVGYSNGSILSITHGGTGAYSYQWIPAVAGNSPNATNLSSGNYELIITDANNCKDTTNNVLNNPTGLSLLYSKTPATCNQSNGSIIINSANGTGTVSVQWVNPTSCGSSYTCPNLSAGIYSIKLTDSNGCTDTLLATVTNSGGPTVTTATTNANCYGTCNGAASVEVTGGASPFIFAWNSPPTVGSVVSTATTSIASGLCDSTYISIVTDAIGCKTITSFSISEPTQIHDSPSITSATCFGINNGSITSMASGGTHFANGYEYSIDGGGIFGPSVSHAFTNLAAGTHTVTITDSVSCTRTFTYTVPPASVITSSISATNVTCFGNCNGTATVLNIVGGTAPITITWNDPASQVGNFATNLCGGTYTATITDHSGCQAYDTISIISPSAINPNTVVTNPACGQCNGNITVTPSGGNGPVYTYTWTSPPSNGSSLSNICAGPYQVNITDNLGCTQTFQIPVSSSGAPTLTLTSTNVACNTTCSGSATVTASGGLAPYTYTWPNVTPVSTSSVVSALCSNTTTPYFVQVKDSLGCIATQTVTITAPQSFTVTNTNVSPSCTVCNGSITVTVIGSSNYSYLWGINAGSATTPTVGGLCAGIYVVVVTDNVSGCTQTTTITLNNNAGPTLNVVQTNATCFGMCNGSATVTATFGAPPGCTYTWTPSGGNGTVASNLCDNTYFVLVTDGAGCIQTSQVNITSPAALVAGLPTVSPIKCTNDCNGSINTVIFGGTPAYTYSWSSPAISGLSATNLCSGNYSLTVTDANGCSVQEFDTLVNPTPLITTGTVTPSSCNTFADGMITTLTSGGTPTYTYQWSGGSNAQTQNLTTALSGTYTLVATDAHACTDTTHYTLTSAVTVIANAGRDTTLCSNAPIVLTGTVTGTTTFDWQDISGNIIPPANTLTLSVDPNVTTPYVLMAFNGLCKDYDTVNVDIGALAIANAGANQSVFFGQTATIGGHPSNPTGGTIVWTPNIGLSDTASSNPVASPTVTTTYTLTVTNALGCAVTDTMIVTILPPFNINNGFTPNGDGKNDTWVIDELYKFPNTEIEIYNRWGEQLFYSKGAYIPWNGTYNGSPVPVGTYYYIIRLNDKNFPDHYAGPLTILR
jgi:gliding motility-associated-like protein